MSNGQNAVEIPENHAFDVDVLEKFLKGVPSIGLKGNLAAKKFDYGQSNPTFLLESTEYHDGADPSQRWVMRKKPPGKLIKGAHAVEREYRIMETLGKVGFEVPTMHVLCEDNDVIGTPFYIMEFCEGRIVANTLEDVPKSDRKAAMFAMVHTLGDLHKFDPTEIGLMEGKPYGKLTGFYERQIATMKRTSEAQVAAAKGKLSQMARMDDLLQAFAANMPDDESAIVHGDFKPDNNILHPTEAKVIGLIDWELSTIGHPLSDLANFTLPYSSPPDHFYGSIDLSPDSGIPSLDELMQEYCKAAGRPYPIPNWKFFVAFAWLRLAVILHGIAARATQGVASQAVSGSDMMVLAESTAELSWKIISGELPLIAGDTSKL